MKNKDTGEVKGYAFVAFKTKEDGQRAIDELKNKEFKVILIHVTATIFFLLAFFVRIEPCVPIFASLMPFALKLQGKTLRCSLSDSKHRLFIGNIPKSLSEDQFKKLIHEVGPGAEMIDLKQVNTLYSSLPSVYCLGA